MFLIFFYFLLLLLITKPMGVYLTRVFQGERTLLSVLLRPLEDAIYRFSGIDPEGEMRWSTYTIAMLFFNVVGIFVLYFIFRLQPWHPFNPKHFPALAPDLAFNTAVSFVTNTNWQAYGGEITMSYFSQMVALTWQNFVSAATGLALAIALIRGLTQRAKGVIGNFWVDLVRALLYVFLPISIFMALFFVSQGVIQNLAPYLKVITLEGKEQLIAQGPVASQEAIKMLGTNGGGFFNANSAHPYENPTPLTNFVQMFSIFLIPAGLTYMVGRWAKDQRQGWTLFGAMTFLFLLGALLVAGSEQHGNPHFAQLGASERASTLQSGGNMEGKEVRFGITASSLFATLTTDASCGAVNSMHDSFTPLAGGVLILNIALGEIIFGGVGAGLLGILVFAIIAVFIAGLMVGRTPEYLGKKIQVKEMKMAMLAVLVLAVGMLVFGALAVETSVGLRGRLNLGPHGLTEILYAVTSAVGNNGSAFAGLTVNTPFYNILLGIGMLLGRFFFIIPVMAIAGAMAEKQVIPPSSGTFPTTGILFSGLLVGVILIVGALTFFPVYALGPIVEHALMHGSKLF